MLAALLVTACASSAGDPESSDPLASGAVTSDPAVSDPAVSGPVVTDALTSDAVTTGGTDAGAAEPTPVDSSAVNTEGPGVRPEGFDTTLARATMPDGSVCELCVWLADTAPQRSRGLMFVTDLGDADAMAFRYPEPHTGTFWMKNTVLPLSIAFFAPDGGFLTSFDMEPCTSDPCPNYRTADDFAIAVEVPQGDLADLGLVDGTTFELLDLPCND